MRIHGNARLTVSGRRELVRRIEEAGWSVADAALAVGISERSAWKWLLRFRSEGEVGLQDRSSRPVVIPRRLSVSDLERACQQRVGNRWPVARIARELGLPRSTLARALVKQGLGRLPPLTPHPPVVRYEHPYPGSMIHLDIKTLGRFTQPGHRVTGNRRQDTPKAGKECIHVCVDDASRLAYVEVLPDEKKHTTTRFLLRALRWLKGLGVDVERVLTDNGSAYRSKTFAKACRRLKIKHKRTRPYTPRTNGKAERFIQSLLREWAYAQPYNTSALRNAALPDWVSHYNQHRPHTALHGKPPLSRLAQ